MKIAVPFYLKLACVFIILISGGYLIIIGKTLLAPLLFALLFALLLLPLSNFFENRLKFPRALGATMSLIIFLIGLTLIIYPLSTQISNLSKDWPLLKQQVGNFFHDFQIWIQNKFNVNIYKQSEYINETKSKVLKSDGGIIQKTMISISTLLLLSIFTLIYTFFILIYRRHLMAFILAAFPGKYHPVICEISKEIKSIVRKYITGLSFQMGILIALSGLVFWLIGLKYIFLLALFVGVLNIIPYIGIYTALLIGVCVTLATSDTHHALYLIVTVIIIHMIDSNFLMPKIVGSQIRINPLVIILGVILGELVWGIPGMFLSVSYLAMAKIIFDRVDGLKPWGVLLGDDEPIPKIKLKLRKSKKNKTLKVE